MSADCGLWHRYRVNCFATGATLGRWRLVAFNNVRNGSTGPQHPGETTDTKLPCPPDLILRITKRAALFGHVVRYRLMESIMWTRLVGSNMSIPTVATSRGWSTALNLLMLLRATYSASTV